jgi:hypothetical protein
MDEGFLGHALGTALAGILSVVAAVGGPSQADQQQSPGTDQNQSGAPTQKQLDKSLKRLKLADKVNVPTGHGRLGRDISWPNCPKGMGIPQRRTLGHPLPPASARYVIIGLTNGPGFYPNPCLREQVADARARHFWTSAYSVITYPTRAQLAEYGDAGPSTKPGVAGRLWNTGWAQAQQNVTNMHAAGLVPPTVWLDVEPVRPPAPWSSSTSANRTVLEGAIAAYRKAGLQLGVYSTPYLWKTVVGDVSYGFPEWRAAGPTSIKNALGVCKGDDIQGGDAVLGQWSSIEEDFDVICPGVPALQALRGHFTPY